MQQPNGKEKKSKEQITANVRTGYQATCRVLSRIWYVLYRSRKLLLTIPVIFLSVYLAGKCQSLLPSSVGIWLLENGSYRYMVSREMAIYGPLVLTGGCLLMMCFSRRTLYPWLISLFSLAVPVLILLTNDFPGFLANVFHL